MSDLLIDEELYRTSGVHIGTQQKSANMRAFIAKVRDDGLYFLDINRTDERLRIASRFLASFEPADILVVSQRQYGKTPVRTFASLIGAEAMAGRFVPGTLTNHNLKDFREPRILLVTDPAADIQALREAASVHIPIIGLCDANNNTRFVDLILPTNNKGRRSLAAIYWLLTRETMKAMGRIGTDEEFTLEIEDFEAAL